MDPQRKAEKAQKEAEKQAAYEQEIAGLEFHEWPKIGRLNRDVVITEKIDGTNAAIGIISEMDGYRVYAQSRTRIITPDNDNYAFAAWVQKNAAVLIEALGVGLHFGEWWGVGIARNYGLSERRFSLFNTAKWGAGEGAVALEKARAQGVAIYSVPVLYTGPWTGVFGYIDATQPAKETPGQNLPWLTAEQMGGWEGVQDQPNPRPRFAPSFILEYLARVGSQAAPGFAKPEGVVVFHRASNTCFKATVEHDDEWKGKKA
jgi:hypothetical protein